MHPKRQNLGLSRCEPQLSPKHFEQIGPQSFEFMLNLFRTVEYSHTLAVVSHLSAVVLKYK